MFFPITAACSGWSCFSATGLKYQNTRHNAGFLTADVVEKDCGVRIDRLRFHARSRRRRSSAGRRSCS
ncbi:MAG: hypothetical protein ACLRRN_02490 [Oscillospiraceae bacterium]